MPVVEMARRRKDNAVFVSSPQLRKRASEFDFYTSDGSTPPPSFDDVAPTAVVISGAGQELANRLAIEFEGMSADDLRAYLLERFQFTAPAAATHPQLMGFIAVYRGTEITAAAGATSAGEGQSSMQGQSSNSANDSAPDAQDPYPGKSNQDLADMALSQYGYQMPVKLTRKDRIAKLAELAKEKSTTVTTGA